MKKNSFRFKDKQQNEKIASLTTLLCLLTLAVLLMSLIPLLAIAKYNLPLGDDLIYGEPVRLARLQDTSLGSTLSAAADVVAEKYFSWQGTFSAIFLMALQPGVFGDVYYAMTPYIMLAALIVSTMFLLYTLMCDLLNTSRSVWLLIGSVILLFSIQLTVSAREAFFWYNGAVYYTLFHSMLLILMAIVVRMFRVQRWIAKMVLATLGILLSVIISGGNYATAMVAGEFLFCTTAYAAVKKRYRLLACFALMLLLFGVGMLISMNAPGNDIRQADVIASGYSQSGPLKAIILSFALGGAFALSWFNVACVAIILIVVIFLGPAIRKVKWNFRYPLIVVAFLFCVFSSQFTPSVYAATSPGPYRLRNVIYFMYLLMVAFDAAYITGWAQRTLQKESSEVQTSAKRMDLPLHKLVAYPIITILCFAFLLGAGIVSKGYSEVPSVIAATEIWDGTAQEHAEQRLRQQNEVTEPGLDSVRESKLLS